MSGRPPARWRTLARAECMRVPLPAARITMEVSAECIRDYCRFPVELWQLEGGEGLL